MKNRFMTSVIVLLAGVALMAGTIHAKTLKISHVRPQGTAIDKDLRWFSDTLKEASGGELKTKIYPASALGDYTIVQ